MISRFSPARLTGVIVTFLAAGLLRADTNQALTELLRALVANKTLTAEQAALVQSVANEKPASPAPASTAASSPKPAAATAAQDKAAPAAVYAVPKEKGITRLSIAGMIHPQWDHVSVDVPNGPQPATRNTYLMRRMKLAVAGEITSQWGGLVEADFAGSNTLEQGYISYKGIRDTEIVFGHTKVPFLKEELLSDGVYKGVERSASHRAFVEQAGRGFGAKNTGLQLRGKRPNGFNYVAAITNTGAKNSGGTAGNVANELAYYAQLGYGGAVGSGRLEYAIQGGYLPDLLAAGPITATAAHVFYDGRRFGLLAEIATARYARAVGSARQTGFTIEPAFKFTPEWELVVRYAAVDSNGLGLSPGSLIRNAPATGDFDRLESYVLGGNYYFSGQAVRFTFGYEYAKATGRITGAANENVINGFRSRLQLLY